MASVTWATHSGKPVIKMHADTAPCQLGFPLPHVNIYCIKIMGFTCFLEPGSVNGQSFRFYYGFVSGTNQWPGDSDTRLFMGGFCQVSWSNSTPSYWQCSDNKLIYRTGSSNTTISSGSNFKLPAIYNGNVRHRAISVKLIPREFKNLPSIQYGIGTYAPSNNNPHSYRDLSNFEKRTLVIDTYKDSEPWHYTITTASYTTSIESDNGPLDHLYIGIIGTGGSWYPVTMYIRSLGFEVEKVDGYLFA